jgi:hypothetical protein
LPEVFGIRLNKGLPGRSSLRAIYSIFHVDIDREKPGFLNRISNDARTVKKPGFWAVLHKPGIGCNY